MLTNKVNIQNTSKRLGEAASNKVHGRNKNNKGFDIIKVYNPGTNKAEGSSKEDKLLDTADHYINTQKKILGKDKLSLSEAKNAANNVLQKVTNSSGNDWYKINNESSQASDPSDIYVITTAKGIYDSYWSKDGPSLDQLVKDLQREAYSKSEAEKIIKYLYEKRGQTGYEDKVKNAIDANYGISTGASEPVPNRKLSLKEAQKASKIGGVPSPNTTKILMEGNDYKVSNNIGDYALKPENSFEMYLRENPDASRADALGWLVDNNLYNDETSAMLNVEFTANKNKLGFKPDEEYLKAVDDYVIAEKKGDVEAAAENYKKAQALAEREKAFEAYVRSGGDNSTSKDIDYLNHINKLIDDQEKLLESASGRDVMDIQSQIAVLEQSRDYVTNSLRSKFSTTLDMKNKTDALISEYQKDFINDISFGLAGNIKSLNNEIKMAEALGDTDKLDALKSEKKRLVGVFVGLALHDIGSMLRGIKIAGSQGEPVQGPMFLQQMLAKGLESATSRISGLKDQSSAATLKFLEENLKADQSIIQNYNDMVKDASTKEIARKLSENELIASAYVKEELGKHLKNIDSSELAKAIMYSMGGNGDSKGLLFSILATVDDGTISSVIDSLSKVAASVGETTTGVADSINEFIKLLNSALGVGNNESLWTRATNK